MKEFIENLTRKDYKALETLANFDCMSFDCNECPFNYEYKDSVHNGCMSLYFSHLLNEIDKEERV